MKTGCISGTAEVRGCFTSITIIIITITIITILIIIITVSIIVIIVIIIIIIISGRFYELGLPSGGAQVALFPNVFV